jgi:simple sugar transport system ATP-binding protein
MKLLEAIKINKSYGHVSALTDVDFHINEAEVVGLMGDNGAGKSTLIKIISGVVSPDSGELRVRGQSMKNWSVKLARQFGIETVYQDQALSEQQNITTNVFMGREKCGALGFLRLKEQTEEARRLMRNIGFTSKVLTPDSVVADLSGGERQGVAIARALYYRAQLIILDEPTTALSLSECEKVFRFVDRIRQEGSSCIFISHNPYHTYGVADRFVVIDRGSAVLSVEKHRTTVEQLIGDLQEIARCGRDETAAETRQREAGGSHGI